MTSSDKPSLARRYKTTPCKRFAVTGRCPYALRCMFAHGERDLRTAEQNIRDGLTDDAAIRLRQQLMQELARDRQRERQHANRCGYADGMPPVAQEAIRTVLATTTTHHAHSRATRESPDHGATPVPDVDRGVFVSGFASLSSEAPRSLESRASPLPSEFAADTPRTSDLDSDSTNPSNTTTAASLPAMPSTVRVEYDQAVYVSPLAAAMLSSHVTVTADDDQHIASSVVVRLT